MFRKVFTSLSIASILFIKRQKSFLLFTIYTRNILIKGHTKITI